MILLALTCLNMSRTVDEILDVMALEDCEATPEKITSVLTTLTLGEEKWRDHHGVLKEEGMNTGPVGSLLSLNRGQTSLIAKMERFRQWVATRAVPVHFDESVGMPHACGCYS